MYVLACPACYPGIFLQPLKRDSSIDALKAVMVFLVVLGHTGGYDPLIRKVIYSFHMPVFVFLSGYLTSSGTPKEKRRKWFIKTVLIYACAQAAHVLLGFAAQKSTDFLEVAGMEAVRKTFRCASSYAVICPGTGFWSGSAGP